MMIVKIYDGNLLLNEAIYEKDVDVNECLVRANSHMKKRIEDLEKQEDYLRWKNIKLEDRVVEIEKMSVLEFMKFKLNKLT